ncbi:DUF1801 domain-containing protein [Chiayiivirga flava]|uniref:YdhG-like domain-containing protein n=1 Tax=Chiayiivirga flava TaxID=659595 RepID=A0A7W8FZ77_9GAMM|nr:DUF1801 domain-containing protein [Chiayiivirga flava]MBB5206904.1 hypothetical protein [Chiayiivirga flava]
MPPAPRRTPAAAPPDVDAFFATLDHPRRDALLAMRSAILGADPSIAEGIKWNVPSFRTRDWFATLHLRARTGVGVILHLGAKKTAASEHGVPIDDPDGLLQWLARDRAMVAFRDLADVSARRDAFVALIRRWIAHL